MNMQTKTEILIEATQRLAESIDSIDGVANAAIFEAAQRLDELQKALQSAHASLVLARNERDEARGEVERLKASVAIQMEINAALADVKTPVRPEPSRLEIAAIILTGSYGNSGAYKDLAIIGLKQADALIAAVKEAQ